MFRQTGYMEGIYKFLATCTIKNDWIARQSIATMTRFLRVSRIPKEAYSNIIPYYVNMAGKYFVYDNGRVLTEAEVLGVTEPKNDGISNAPMFVRSIDTQETILFHRLLLEDHPKTKFAYRVGSENYKDLLTRYPTQVDLIKNILHPVEDVESAVDAPNYSLLASGIQYLEDQEVGSILENLTNFLTAYERRWNVKEFEFEALSPIAQWAGLWSLLPNVIATQRVRNIRTTSAHSYHIWEYLTSHGLGDYRSILTVLIQEHRLHNRQSR